MLSLPRRRHGDAQEGERDEREQEWPEQERYEELRPLVLFDVSVAERAQEVGTSASTLYRRLDGFAEEGMEALFAFTDAV